MVWFISPDPTKTPTATFPEYANLVVSLQLALGRAEIAYSCRKVVTKSATAVKEEAPDQLRGRRYFGLSEAV